MFILLLVYQQHYLFEKNNVVRVYYHEIGDKSYRLGIDPLCTHRMGIRQEHQKRYF